MRIFSATLLFLFTSFCIAQKLPVLSVNFPGSFKKGMDYVQGTMKLTDTDGTVIDLPAKFKTRGATALNYSMKPSFNMKLREADGTEIDSSLCGIRSCSSWVLDAMAIDRINMRNRVAFDVWNSYSKLPYNTNFGSRNGTHGQFVEVYINNIYKGIYCLTDRINRKLLDLKKTKINTDETGAEDGTFTIRGVQYKHGTTSYGDQNTPGIFLDSTVCVAAWHDAWELTEPEDFACKAAWQPLLDYYNNKSSYAYIKEHFYLENLVDYTLLIMAMSISDNWGNKNQYLSIRNIQTDGNKTRMVYSPWDLDTSLGGSYDGKNYGGKYSNWAISDVAKSANPPFSTCLRESEFKQMLKDRWVEIREGAFAIDSVSEKLYGYARSFVESGAWQRQNDYFNSQKYKPCLVEDLYSEVNMVAEWYQDRFQKMDAYFGIEETSISSATATTKPEKWYNLQGQPTTPSAKGIYIVNGKKIKR